MGFAIQTTVGNKAYHHHHTVTHNHTLLTTIGWVNGRLDCRYGNRTKPVQLHWLWQIKSNLQIFFWKCLATFPSKQWVHYCLCAVSRIRWYAWLHYVLPVLIVWLKYTPEYPCICVYKIVINKSFPYISSTWPFSVVFLLIRLVHTEGNQGNEILCSRSDSGYQNGPGIYPPPRRHVSANSALWLSESAASSLLQTHVAKQISPFMCTTFVFQILLHGTRLFPLFLWNISY